MKKDAELEPLLERLPAVEPGARFSERVLLRLDELPAGRGPLPALLAAVVVAVLVIASGLWINQRQAEQERQQAVEALRVESRQLRDELRQLRESNQPPLLYVGGDGVDVFVDPAPVAGVASRGPVY